MTRLYSCHRPFFGADGPQRGNLLFPRLLKRRRGVTLRRLRLIELLGGHIGFTREGPEPFGGARRKLKVRLVHA